LSRIAGRRITRFGDLSYESRNATERFGTTGNPSSGLVSGQNREGAAPDFQVHMPPGGVNRGKIPYRFSESRVARIRSDYVTFFEVFAKSSPGTPASDGAADDCVIDKIQGLRGIEWVKVGSEGRRKLCIA
jgi:hypothetical protein